jgi:hypothetical protein
MIAGKTKWYVEFWHESIDYRLSMANDSFLQHLRGQGRLHDGPRPEKCVCISIGIYFEPRDAHYKLATAGLP